VKKHIYLHSSKHEHKKNLREDPDFKSPFELDILERVNLLPNEYGRIVTKEVDYHILIGSLPHDNCPWCGHGGDLIQLPDSRSREFSSYCIQCRNCSSRGPVLNVRDNLNQSEEELKEYFEVIWQKYKWRRPWDADFVNPYEGKA